MEIPRILIVEDDGIIARHLQAVLKKFGYQVQGMVPSGEEALAMAEGELPDLVLMDIELAGEMDGVQTAEQFQARFQTPVVYLTAFAGDQLVQRAKLTNPFGYITKPFEERHLHATLELALQKHRYERELQANHERYLAVVTQTSEGIVLVDTETYRVEEANTAFQNLVGLWGSDIIGKLLYEVLLIPYQPFIDAIKKLMVEHQMRMTDQAFHRQDGEIIYLDVTATLVRSPHQMLICAIVRDETERHLAEIQLHQLHEKLEEDVRQRTAELAQANRQLRALLDGIPDMAWFKDEVGRFVAVNQRMADACHLPVEQLVGKNDYDFFPRELAESYQRDDRRVIETGQMLKIEERFKPTQGGEIWVESIKVPVLNDQGAVIGAAGIARDITSRKQSDIFMRQSHAELEELVSNRTRALEEVNEQLRSEIIERQRAQDNYRGIFENAAIGIYQASLIGRFTIVNPALAKMFGYDSPKEMIEQVTDLATQIYADPQRRKDVVAAGLSAVGFIEIENEYRRKDGSNFFGIAYFRVIRDDQGQSLHIEGFVSDITERRQAQEAIRVSEERYRNIYNQTPAMLHSIDAQGRLVSVSDYWLEMLGYTREEVLGRLFTDFMPGESQRYAREVVMPAFLRSGVCKDVPQQVAKKNGEVLDVLLSAVSERDGAGKSLRNLSVFVDVTERNRAEQKLQMQLRRMASLRAVEMSITARMDLRDILDTLLEQVIAQLGVDAACVLLFNPRTQALEDAADSGFRTTNIKSTHLHMGEGLAGLAVVDRRMVSANNLSSQIEAQRYVPYLMSEGFVSYYGVPLIVKGVVKGVLEVYHRSLLNPPAEWLEFLEALAGQAAIAIDNKALFEEEQRANFKLTRAFNATIEGWSRAQGLRDQETEEHAERVSRLTLDLARYVGVPDSEMDHLRRGALLHDIGKMGLPDSILMNPGPLTPEEWTKMRMHPQYAFEWLSSIDFLRPALDIPYCHHERWNGSGYPRGLKGTQIPLSARIFAVVDVYDSLSSDRRYRPSMHKAEVVKYLEDQSGLLFEPEIVRAFLKMLEEK
jgi:PAS domain S-box-containing protein/putative nucleotidyltransferase with HDIG domain